MTSPWPSTWSSQKLDKASVNFERVRIRKVDKSALWIGPEEPGMLVVPENPRVLKALEHAAPPDAGGHQGSSSAPAPALQAQERPRTAGSAKGPRFDPLVLTVLVLVALLIAVTIAGFY